MSNFLVMSYTNFRKEDIEALVIDLALPPMFVTRKREHFSALEALVVFLCRFASSDKWERHLTWLGSRDRSSYSRVFYMVLDIVYDRYASRMAGIHMWDSHAPMFAAQATACGSPAPRVMGFIDGTFRRIPRPLRNQKHFYSGYKKGHGVKYQTVQAVNGIIIDYYGPITGRHGDGYLFAQSGILRRMSDLCRRTGSFFYVYGDPAYRLSRFVLRGFKGGATPAQKAFSTSMSKLRVSVEWGYGAVVNAWPLLDLRRRSKLGEVPVGKLYAAGVFLYNVQTCMYGNEVSAFFDCPPPPVAAYLRLVRNTPRGH